MSTTRWAGSTTSTTWRRWRWRPLKKSVDRVPTNATYRYHLGMVYAKTGEPQKAREMLAEALKLEPNSPSAADAKRTLDSLNGGTK